MIFIVVFYDVFFFLFRRHSRSHGQAINDSNELPEYDRYDATGTDSHAKVLRNGNMRDLNVKLGELPSAKEEARNERSDNSKNTLEGVSVENLDAETAKELGLPASPRE